MIKVSELIQECESVFENSKFSEMFEINIKIDEDCNFIKSEISLKLEYVQHKKRIKQEISDLFNTLFNKHRGKILINELEPKTKTLTHDGQSADEFDKEYSDLIEDDWINTNIITYRSGVVEYLFEKENSNEI